MIEITPKRLYQIGFYCFFIVALMGVINFIVYFQVNNIFSKISSFASLIFNFALAFFFKYMLSLEPQIEEGEATDDINQLIKEVSNGGKSGVQGEKQTHRTTKRSRHIKA